MRFDSYHPIINLIFFFSIILLTIIIKHPVFVVISFVSAFMYSVKLNGLKGLIFNVILIPLIGIYAGYYCYCNHFGTTNLMINVIGNEITLEALYYGFVSGTIIASILMWFSCVNVIMSSDKIIYLFGRILPKLSLYISIILRIIPRIKEQYSKISNGRSCIGKGAKYGNVFVRLLNYIKNISILVTWLLDNFVQTKMSMISRGYSLKKRTAFSIYRFDNRDRILVIIIFFNLTIITMGIMLDQTKIIFSPSLILNKVTFSSNIFFVSYAFYSLLPFMLEEYANLKFNRLQKYN